MEGPSGHLVVLGTSIPVSYPANQPICTCWEASERSRNQDVSNWHWTLPPSACQTPSHANQALSNRTVFWQVRIHCQVSALQFRRRVPHHQGTSRSRTGGPRAFPRTLVRL